MYDHQIKRYSLAEQHAVYRWFIISGITIASVGIVLVLSIIVQYQDQSVSCINREQDIKQLEEQIKHAREMQEFIKQIQSNNQKQLEILEQLAICIPDQVCLNEAKINSTHICLKGDSYTYNALFDYQKALESCLHNSFVIKSMDKQQELIAFVLETGN